MTETNKKIAIVTGASRGIGAAIAMELAAQGFVVAGTATSEKGAATITQKLKDAGFEGKGFVLNVADQSSIEQFIKDTNEELGNPLVLINNAAITKDNILVRMKLEEWTDVLETNLNSIYLLSKLCLRPMMKNRWGRIINISSVVGSTGNPGQANYAAAKAGMLGFSKSLASEIASRGVTVNVVSPGFIQTDMTNALPESTKEALINTIPMKKLGCPEDIAKTVAFLASSSADYITGQTIHVNGGMYMC